jgi:spore coat protein U-like protein
VLTGTAYADASCTVSSTGVSFGAYDVFNTDTTGNISVACTGLTESSTVAYDILISTGGGSYPSRAMTSGGHLLNYNLYINNSRSIVWGDGSAGTAKISDGYGLGLSAVIKDYSIYGRIPARQNGYVGSYSDMIIVTVNYL